MKKIVPLLLFWLVSLAGFSQNHWQPNIHQFPTNMNVIATIEINGIEQQNTYLELGVFCGDECRGSQMLDYYDDPVSRYLVFLTAYGQNGDPFTFRLYDHFTGQELDLVSHNEMSYHTNDIIGMLFTPYVFSFTGGSCEVNVDIEPTTAGTVTGSGSMPCGTYCTLTATPAEGCTFLCWSKDGEVLSAEPEFSFNAVADLSLVASFEEPYVPETYEVVVWVDPTGTATVTGAGTYDEGSSCTLTVSPSPNYEFLHWTEGGEVVSTETSYTFEVTRNRTIVARLSHITALEENLLKQTIHPNPTYGPIIVEGKQAGETIAVYDLSGRKLIESTENTLNLEDLQDGVYLIRIGDNIPQRVLLIH